MGTKLSHILRGISSYRFNYYGNSETLPEEAREGEKEKKDKRTE